MNSFDYPQKDNIEPSTNQEKFVSQGIYISLAFPNA